MRLKKGLLEKVRDWNGNQAVGSNCHLCTGIRGPRDCGDAKCAETSLTSENKRLLLPRGMVLGKKKGQERSPHRKTPGSPDLKSKKPNCGEGTIRHQQRPELKQQTMRQKDAHTHS